MRNSAASEENAPLRWAAAETELGWLMLAATPRGIAWLQFGDSPEALEAALREDFPGLPGSEDEEGLAEWMAAARALAAGEPAGAASLPLDPRGTDFQRQVWEALRAIPRGETRTYAQLAAQISRADAIRAVGAACARNPIALLIPCHRVVEAGGGLAGFRWGVERKKRLLELEGALRRADQLALDFGQGEGSAGELKTGRSGG